MKPIIKSLVLTPCFVLLAVILAVMASLISSSAYALGDNDTYCLYQKKEFSGNTRCGNDEVRWLGWSWHKRVQSVEVKDGYELEVYPYWGFWGTPTVLSGEHATLKGRQKRFASFKIN